jgi:hypothetical protein
VSALHEGGRPGFGLIRASHVGSSEEWRRERRKHPLPSYSRRARTSLVSTCIPTSWAWTSRTPCVPSECSHERDRIVTDATAGVAHMSECLPGASFQPGARRTSSRRANARKTHLDHPARGGGRKFCSRVQSCRWRRSMESTSPTSRWVTASRPARQHRRVDAGRGPAIR